MQFEALEVTQTCIYSKINRNNNLRIYVGLSNIDCKSIVLCFCIFEYAGSVQQVLGR